MSEWDEVQFDLYLRYRKTEKRSGRQPLAYEDWILRFRGEKGDKGDRGERGPAGESGQDGKDGLDGKSVQAFEVFSELKNDKDFVDSIKGDTGARGLRGYKGLKGLSGKDGVDGFNGWTPILAVVEDGERRVLKVTDWTGGSGLKPEFNVYVGADGYTYDIELAVDIRGEKGERGQNGVVKQGFGGGGSFDITDLPDYDTAQPNQVFGFDANGVLGFHDPLDMGIALHVPDYTERYDTVGNYIYVGKAVIDSAESDAAWKIYRFLVDENGDSETLWADGDSDFDNIWDNRLTYTYN